jgi:hypothetical protein
MGRHHQQAFFLFHHPLDPLDVAEAEHRRPGFQLHQPRRKQHIHDHHHELLKRPLAGGFQPGLVLVRETGPQVIQCALSAAMIAFPHNPANPAGRPQICLHRETIKQPRQYPHKKI